jgi:hypothetical protein
MDPTAGFDAVKVSSIAPVGSRNTIPLTFSPQHNAHGIPDGTVYIAFNATGSSRLARRDAVWSGINISRPRKNVLPPHFERERERERGGGPGDPETSTIFPASHLRGRSQ